MCCDLTLKELPREACSMESRSSRDCNCGDRRLGAGMMDSVTVTVALHHIEKGKRSESSGPSVSSLVTE